MRPEDRRKNWREATRRYRAKKPKKERRPGMSLEARRKQKRAWGRANPDKVREMNRRYVLANRHKVLEQKRRYYQANRAEINFLKGSYQKTIRAKLRRYARNYYRQVYRGKILERHRANATTLRDVYVKKLLSVGSILRATDFPPEVVELKRTQLKLHRELRKQTR